MTKEQIIWRLKEQPTSESLRQLVKDTILTKDEAREILFSKQQDKPEDSESMKSEIKFLRELVDTLSKNQQHTIANEVIRYYPTYKQFKWIQPYYTMATTPLQNGTYSINCSSIN